jgi:transcriptional regulator with XRE-family HTH domain
MSLNKERIKALREKLGLTQDEAARLAGFTSRQAWNNLEGGAVPNPRADTLAKVAKALGCRMEDLLQEDPPAKGKGKGKTKG